MSPGRSRDSFLTARWTAMVALVRTARSRWPEGPIGYIQRWRRSLAQYHGIRYWLLVQGPIVLLFLGALFVINGFTIGWQNAYDVTVQITSPWDDAVVNQPLIALPLSLAGWLVWPSVTGAVVGYVLTDPTKGRRGKSGNILIPLLDGVDVPEQFARYFEKLHDGRRKRAKSHWEQIVNQFLTTDVVSRNAHSQRKMDQAVSASIEFLYAMPDKRCPICPQADEE